LVQPEFYIPYLDYEPVELITTNIQEKLNEVCKQFTLNEKQEKAFRCFCETLTEPTYKQKLVYVGGEGGTGKSQIIKR
jgi:hypothetical protein